MKTDRFTEGKHSRAVVITGMGIVCPLGLDVQTAWRAVLTSTTGMDRITTFDASGYPTRFAAEVKGFDLKDFLKTPGVHLQGNRACQFVVAAAVQACSQAGIRIQTDSPDDGIERRRMGIYLGSGEGPVQSDVFFDAIARAWDPVKMSMDWNKWSRIALQALDPIHNLEQEPHMPSRHLAILTGARGPVRTCLTACAASTQAIGEAMMLIRLGRADVMITGGCHSMIHPLGIMGFNRLTALSTRNNEPKTASRPFSASRDGFVTGEGAAILILESLESALNRGIRPLAQIVGYGTSADAFRVTDMHDQARGPIQAMRGALRDANLTPEDIDYVNAHGTGTMENDHIETLAIKTVFGNRTVPVSSIKGSMGHLIAAAGAAELVCCVMALQQQIIPPTANLYDQDPSLDLDYVPLKPRPATLQYIMKESFGFGGQNNVVIIKRYP